MTSVPRGGLVAEDAAARAVHERVDDLVRESVGVRRERRRRDDSHHLPVALWSCPCPSSARAGVRPRRATPAAAGTQRAASRCRAPEPPCSGGRGRPPPRPYCPACSSPRPRIPRRRATLRPRLRRGRSRTRAALRRRRQATRRQRTRRWRVRETGYEHGAILRPPWTRPSGSCCSRCTSPRIVALAAGVTYAAIRIFPTKDSPSKKDDDKPPTSTEGTRAGSLFRRSKREAAG